jgi:hypothetical protein
VPDTGWYTARHCCRKPSASAESPNRVSVIARDVISVTVPVEPEYVKAHRKR